MTGVEEPAAVVEFAVVAAATVIAAAVGAAVAGWHVEAVAAGAGHERLGIAEAAGQFGSKAAGDVLVDSMRLRLNNVDAVIVVQGGDRWKMPGAAVDVAVVDAADVGIAAAALVEDPVEVGYDSDVVHSRAVLVAQREVGKIDDVDVRCRGRDPAFASSMLHGLLVVVA